MDELKEGEGKREEERGRGSEREEERGKKDRRCEGKEMRGQEVGKAEFERGRRPKMEGVRE